MRRQVLPFCIRNEYNIPYSKLLEFNDLDNVDILQEPTLCILKRNKKAAQKIITSQSNENMHDIAQEEGVQLKSLIAYNKIDKSIQPKAGDKILLHRKQKTVLIAFSLQYLKQLHEAGPRSR